MLSPAACMPITQLHAALQLCEPLRSPFTWVEEDGPSLPSSGFEVFFHQFPLIPLFVIPPSPALNTIVLRFVIPRFKLVEFLHSKTQFCRDSGSSVFAVCVTPILHCLVHGNLEPSAVFHDMFIGYEDIPFRGVLCFEDKSLLEFLRGFDLKLFGKSFLFQVRTDEIGLGVLIEQLVPIPRPVNVILQYPQPAIDPFLAGS
mmetsp:Transcript_17802/g.35910  ORF Transcript_17802/g.35910 Transcript_17802/m.35910 type:complete len:201 (+) Transcript_17802:340-942(+)